MTLHEVVTSVCYERVRVIERDLPDELLAMGHSRGNDLYLQSIYLDSRVLHEAHPLNVFSELLGMHRGIQSWLDKSEEYFVYVCGEIRKPLEELPEIPLACDGCPLREMTNAYCNLTFQLRKPASERQALQERINFTKN